MSTRIGLISDVHATAKPLKQAIELFRQRGVDKILCAGDIAGYGKQLAATVELLKQCQCLAISGNHDRWFLQSDESQLEPDPVNYLDSLARSAEFNIEGKRVYMVHAHPPLFDRGGIKLLDMQGNVSLPQKEFWHQQLAKFNFDILIVGHTHQVFAEEIGGTLVINPGSTCFNHSCAILQLPQMSVEFFALCGKSYSKIWNWGMFLAE